MKSRRWKQIIVWTVGIILALGIPAVLLAGSEMRSMAAKVGSDKALLASVITDYYQGKSVDERMLKDSTSQIHKILEQAKSEKGPMVSLGTPDTIPSVEDLKSRGSELSYNLPVQFEKGAMTFTFRVRNQEPPIVIWAEVAEGVLPHDDFKKRLRRHLP